MNAPAVRCRATSKQTGKQRKNWAIKGGEVCRKHGGGAPAVKAKAAIRAGVMKWGLGDSTVDPGEVLLRLVTQSAARAEMYARLLQEAFAAAERNVMTDQINDRSNKRRSHQMFCVTNTKKVPGFGKECILHQSRRLLPSFLGRLLMAFWTVQGVFLNGFRLTVALLTHDGNPHIACGIPGPNRGQTRGS
jgi:hypothetical protein